MTMTRRIKAGTTDVSVTIRIIDSTDGTPETGVVWDTSGIDLEYRREGAASADLTAATLCATPTPTPPTPPVPPSPQRTQTAFSCTAERHTPAPPSPTRQGRRA